MNISTHHKAHAAAAAMIPPIAPAANVGITAAPVKEAATLNVVA